MTLARNRSTRKHRQMNSMPKACQCHKSTWESEMYFVKTRKGKSIWTTDKKLGNKCAFGSNIKVIFKKSFFVTLPTNKWGCKVKVWGPGGRGTPCGVYMCSQMQSKFAKCCIWLGEGRGVVCLHRVAMLKLALFCRRCNFLSDCPAEGQPYKAHFFKKRIKNLFMKSPTLHCKLVLIDSKVALCRVQSLYIQLGAYCEEWKKQFLSGWR